MYEYRSNEKKTFEAIVAALLLLFSTATLGASGFFEPPVSLLLRLLGAVGILATAWVAVNTLGKATCIASHQATVTVHPWTSR